MQRNRLQSQQKSSGLKLLGLPQPIVSFPDVFDFLKSCQEKGVHPNDIANMLQKYSPKKVTDSMDKWMFEELEFLMRSMSINL